MKASTSYGELHQPDESDVSRTSIAVAVVLTLFCTKMYILEEFGVLDVTFLSPQ